MHSSECIDHGRAGDKDGYASTCKHEYKGTRNKLKMHRLAYCRSNGVSILDVDDKVVMHKCDNTRCINPDHLELGTLADNNADRVRKGRYCGASSCRAKLTDEDVKFIRANYVRRGKVWNTYTLAAKFGVSNMIIGQVVRGESYKELDDASF